MKRILLGFVCAAMFMAINSTVANAAARPAKRAKVDSDNMQSKQVSLIGTIIAKEGIVHDKPMMEYYLTDLKKKDWELPRQTNFKYTDYEGLKVKLQGMQLGSSLIGIKTLEATDKAAFEARKAELKKAAEEKKAAAKAK